MKNTGLKNRFSQEVRNQWLYWYSCMICGKNQQDVLHHIISPSSHLYVDGEHNESVFNSCPIHNFVCHIGNEAFLYKDETIRMLLWKTADALKEMDYTPNKKDLMFLRLYGAVYSGKVKA